MSKIPLSYPDNLFRMTTPFCVFFMYSLPLIHCKCWWSDHALTMFVGKCLEMWSKHPEYHLNVQSSVCVCMHAHVCMCVRESVLVYVRRLIQKFVDTLNKHSNWIDLWMILYIHIVTPLMNIQTSSPKDNDRSPESNVPRSNLISKNI